MKPDLRLLPLIALAAAPANAAVVLASYDFQSTGGGTADTISTANTVTPSGYTTSVLSGGDGLKGSISPAGAITATSTTGSGNTQHLVIRTIGTDSTDENDVEGAKTANDFYGFTIQATAGNALNLTSFGIDLGRSSTFSGNVFLRSSLDNFTANLNIYSMSASTGTLVTREPVNFDPATFSNLTGPVTFRLYFADNSSATTTGTVFRIDNVILSGDVVPEPASAALAAIGLIGAVSRRRR